MSVLSTTNSGIYNYPMTKEALRARGFFHPKKIDVFGKKVKDETQLWVNHTHFINCANPRLCFYLETKEYGYWFYIDTEIDLQMVLKYCGDEKTYRFLRKTMMEDPRTTKFRRGSGW